VQAGPGVTAEQPTGDDPGYDDDFQLMREEVNKLSGANTDLICPLPALPGSH
jgi:type VI secretion system protein VasJ